MCFIWTGKRVNGDRGQKPCPTRFWMIPKYREIPDKNASCYLLLQTLQASWIRWLRLSHFYTLQRLHLSWQGPAHCFALPRLPAARLICKQSKKQCQRSFKSTSSHLQPQSVDLPWKKDYKTSPFSAVLNPCRKGPAKTLWKWSQTEILTVKHDPNYW